MEQALDGRNDHVDVEGHQQAQQQPAQGADHAAGRALHHEWLDPSLLSRTVATDGPLEVQWFSPEVALVLDREVWGQAFEAPVFCDEVQVVNQRIVGEKHLKLTVKHQGALRDAIWFGHSEPVGEQVTLAYRLSVDEYNGRQRVQMIVEAAG